MLKNKINKQHRQETMIMKIIEKHGKMYNAYKRVWYKGIDYGITFLSKQLDIVKL